MKIKCAMCQKTSSVNDEHLVLWHGGAMKISTLLVDKSAIDVVKLN